MQLENHPTEDDQNLEAQTLENAKIWTLEGPEFGHFLASGFILPDTKLDPFIYKQKHFIYNTL